MFGQNLIIYILINSPDRIILSGGTAFDWLGMELTQ